MLTKESLGNISWLVVGLVIVLVAGGLALLARFLGAGPKDVITLATAIAGLATVAVGLVLAWNASKLFYEKQSQGATPPPTAITNLVANLVAAEPRDMNIGEARRHLAGAKSLLAHASVGATTDQQAAITDATDKISNAEASLPVVAIDLNKLLPTLVTTAAGFAVALVLLGALMLVGSSVAASASTASPSPAASSSAAAVTAAPTAS